MNQLIFKVQTHTHTITITKEGRKKKIVIKMANRVWEKSQTNEQAQAKGQESANKMNMNNRTKWSGARSRECDSWNHSLWIVEHEGFDGGEWPGQSDRQRVTPTHDDHWRLDWSKQLIRTGGSYKKEPRTRNAQRKTCLGRIAIRRKRKKHEKGGNEIAVAFWSDQVLNKQWSSKSDRELKSILKRGRLQWKKSKKSKKKKKQGQSWKLTGNRIWN